MSGDFSRNSFSKIKNFSLVRMQQGRLFTDADWNEQGDLLRSNVRASTADIIGHAGFPQEAAGFELSVADQGNTLLIGAGRAYVNGTSHEALPAAPLRVSLMTAAGGNSVWKVEAGGDLKEGDVLSVGANPGGAQHVVRALEHAQDGTRSFQVTPAFSSATRDVLRVLTHAHQPYLAGGTLPAQNDTYIAMLKSMDVPCTALEDPSLREVAFDGPDTAIRDRTIWQVVLYRRSLLNQRGLNDTALTCSAMATGVDPVLGRREPGKLRARVETSSLASGPCTLPPAAGYRSLENLLYRVEIHGETQNLRFKWSRENAIHRTQYSTIDGTVLVVDSAGRDGQSALKSEDWIEIKDQAAVWSEAPGFFARIGEVQGTRISLAEILHPLTLAELKDGTAPDMNALPRGAFVTRWEGGKPQAMAADISDWVDLENGVQVSFGGARFQSGDYWTIPARAVTGDVEWDVDPFSQAPMLKNPEGPRRDYAALARLTKSNAGWAVSEDCRPIFPTATRSLKVNYAGGDGQEGLPQPDQPNNRVPLPRGLRVSVTQGHAPVAGERIRFRITSGDGRLGNGQMTQDVTTGANGMAAISWSLDSVNYRQTVQAQRLNAAGQPTHAPIEFTATLSRADKVSFDPGDIDALAGADTVQEAIERLADLQQIGCSTHFITPGPGWESVFETQSAGANISVCFSPGEYRLSRAVRTAGLGHVTLHSGGKGIANVVIDRSESAFEFQGCASVTVKGLSISTPASNTGIPNPGKRKGTLDVAQCNDVVIEGCTLSCGGGTSSKRTCISVRSSAGKANRFTRSVRVHNNSFAVGHMQDAVLITDVIDTDVSGNRIGVKPGSATGLSIEAYLVDKVWMTKTINDLVGNPVKGKVTISKPDIVLAAREWRIEFDSPIPQPVWDEILENTPPNKSAMADLESFTKYANERIEEVVEKATEIEAFTKSVSKLKGTLGGNASLLDNPETRRALILTSDLRAYRFDEGADGKQRDVVLEANGAVIAFDSPFSRKDWNTALARSKAAPEVANSEELLSVAYKMAETILKDAQFRRNMGSVANWLNQLKTDGVAMVFQGIICAGRRLDTVMITNNLIRDCQVGVRVAISHSDDRTYRAGTVQIERNRMELMARNAAAYAGYGMLVGNVDTLRILDNDMRLSSRPNFTKYFAQGIRIWGYIGDSVNVSRNKIAMATMGLRLKHVAPETEPDGLWVFAENLIKAPGTTIAHKVEPPNPFIARDNRTL